MKILVIEDDKQTAETIKDELQNYYAVDVAYTGKDGEYQASVNDYDVILIDLVLPDMNGITICKEIRKGGIKTPILILTGQIETKDRVNALDAGADDYLTKPFSFAELLARIRALMRRNLDTIPSNILAIGNLTLNVTNNLVVHKKTKVSLRKKEFGLLEYLMRNKGRVLSRSMILEHVWESGTDPVTNSVDVHVNSLRKKIDRPFKTSLIKTVHGLGYKIEN